MRMEWPGVAGLKSSHHSRQETREGERKNENKSEEGHARNWTPWKYSFQGNEGRVTQQLLKSPALENLLLNIISTHWHENDGIFDSTFL